MNMVIETVSLLATGLTNCLICTEIIAAFTEKKVLKNPLLGLCAKNIKGDWSILEFFSRYRICVKLLFIFYCIQSTFQLRLAPFHVLIMLIYVPLKSP